MVYGDRFCGGYGPPGFVCDPDTGDWVNGLDAYDLGEDIDGKLYSRGAQTGDYYNPDTGRWLKSPEDAPYGNLATGKTRRSEVLSHRELEGLQGAIGRDFYNYDGYGYDYDRDFSYPDRWYDYFSRWTGPPISHSEYYSYTPTYDTSYSWSDWFTRGKPLTVFGTNVTTSYNGDALKASSEKKKIALEMYSAPSDIITNPMCNQDTIAKNAVNERKCLQSITKQSPSIPEGYVNTDSFSSYWYYTAKLAGRPNEVKLTVRVIPYDTEKEEGMVEIEVQYASLLSNKNLGPELVCAFKYAGEKGKSIQVLIFMHYENRITKYILDNLVEYVTLNKSINLNNLPSSIEDAVDRVSQISFEIITTLNMGCYVFSPNFFMYDGNDLGTLRLFDIGTTHCVSKNLDDSDKSALYYYSMMQISVSLQGHIDQLKGVNINLKQTMKKVLKAVFTNLMAKDGLFNNEEGIQMSGSKAIAPFMNSLGALIRKYPAVKRGYSVYRKNDIRHFVSQSINYTNPGHQEQGKTSPNSPLSKFL